MTYSVSWDREEHLDQEGCVEHTRAWVIEARTANEVQLGLEAHSGRMMAEVPEVSMVHQAVLVLMGCKES